MELMVIEVSGFPDVPEVVDQLQIHFQKRSNSGADVLKVIYPISSPGHAYVIFETEQVPGVLQYSHVLEADGTFYDLYVQETHLSKVDMEAETTVDLKPFKNPAKAHQLLKLYSFEIKEDRPNILHLKGSFLSLKLLRKQLAQLLAQDIQPHRRSRSENPYHLSNGYSLASASRVEPDGVELASVAKASAKHGQGNGNGAYAQSWSPVDENASNLDVSPASRDLPQATSPVYGYSGSPRSLPSVRDGLPHSRPSPSHQRHVSLVVDRDILDYVIFYKAEIFKEIETVHRTEMDLKHDEDITMVTFSGRNCVEAQTKLNALIQDIGPRLRTQEIHLKDYNTKEQELIWSRIRLYKDVYKSVLIKNDGDIIKLVGSSTSSFLLKQKLLGHSDDTPTSTQRGRELDRNTPLRRSSSLPRHYREPMETDRGHRPGPGLEATVKEYSAARYQEKIETRKAPRLAQAHPPSLGGYSHRGRSSSERDEVRKPSGQHDKVLLASRGEEQTSAELAVPDMKKGAVRMKMKMRMGLEKFHLLPPAPRNISHKHQDNFTG
ncbi:uncharacterized protein si:dkey-154b15.1 [Hoplias malabaricus]|uniref:uncharacterized protein si:dkey-154b15.1 n=1 Tax=Hoplias malabaricus TaxID=27720 RepID=UPI003461A52B